MHFGFTLDSSDIDLWNIDLLDAHLDLLDTDIPSKYFACLHNVFKTSSRHVFKTSSRHVFKTSSRHVFKTSSRHVFKTSSRHVFKTSWRRLQRNNFSSSKMSSRRLGRRKIVALKTCWRHLQDMSWRHLEGIFKTNKCLLGSIIFIKLYESLNSISDDWFYLLSIFVEVLFC